MKKIEKNQKMVKLTVAEVVAKINSGATKLDLRVTHNTCGNTSLVLLMII